MSQQEHNSTIILLLRALKEYMFHQEVPTSLLAYVTVTEALIAQSMQYTVYIFICRLRESSRYLVNHLFGS